MHNQDDGYLNVEWSLQFLHALLDAGCTELVISPGSRSTPLTLAGSLLDGFNKHVILDERSAAFFALGLSRPTSRPAILICTSGSATANYLPAIVEAHMGYTPLILLTADRPSSLQNLHAPQTIQQENIFGEFAEYLGSTEILVKDDKKRELTLQLARNAWKVSTGEGRPVHINLPFSKPLQPDRASEGEIRKLANELNASTVAHQQKNKPDISDTLMSVVGKLAASKNPVIVSGPLTVRNGSESLFLDFLMDRLPDAVFLLEGTSGKRGRDGFAGLLHYESYLRSAEIREKLRPDFILRIGLPPVSQALGSYLKHHREAEQWCISHARHLPDPFHTSNGFVRVPFFYRDGFSKLNPTTVNTDPDWKAIWKGHETRVYDCIMDATGNETAFTDGNVYRCLFENASPGCDLFISNSLCVRDMDLFHSGRFPFSHVYHNRGASGIDGNISTAAGISTGSDSPLWMVTGDLAFLHDTTGLMCLSKIKGKPLTIIIVNNGGGSIFRMLPVHDGPYEFETYFNTPQNVDFQKLCEAFGVQYKFADNPGSLRKIIQQRNIKMDGCLVIECRTNADASYHQRHKIWDCFKK